MYDPVTDEMATMSGAAKRASEDRNYAKLGREVAEKDKLQRYAAPIADNARKQGRLEGATELVARIEAQRAQELTQPEVGLAGYLNTQEGII